MASSLFWISLLVLLSALSGNRSAGEKAAVLKYFVEDSGYKSSDLSSMKEKFLFSGIDRHKNIERHEDKFSVIDNSRNVLNSTQITGFGTHKQNIINERYSLIYSNTSLKVTKRQLNISVSKPTAQILNDTKSIVNDTRAVSTNMKDKPPSSCLEITVKDGEYQTFGNGSFYIKKFDFTFIKSAYKQAGDTMTICGPEDEVLKFQDKYLNDDVDIIFRDTKCRQGLNFYLMCNTAFLAANFMKIEYFYMWFYFQANMYAMSLMFLAISGLLSPFMFLRYSLFCTHVDFVVASILSITCSCFAEGPPLNKKGFLILNKDHLERVRFTILALTTFLLSYTVVPFYNSYVVCGMIINSCLIAIGVKVAVKFVVPKQSKLGVIASKYVFPIASYQLLLFLSWLLGFFAIENHDYIMMWLFAILICFGRVLCATYVGLSRCPFDFRADN